MSIAVLTQVYDEARRLAIAGSNLAGDDFRLKKLIPPLEKAGAKAPVLGKVADVIRNLVDCPAKDSPQALLELSTLVTAILYTQGQTGAEGNLEEVETSDVGTLATTAGARVMKPLIEALTTTGSGRLEIIRDAHQRGAFQDLRLVNPALAALDDPYPETADFVADHVLPGYGKAIYAELKAVYDPKGKGGHVRRLRLMHRLDPVAAHELVEQALETGTKEMKVAALVCLRHSKEDLPHLLEQATAKSKEVRAAALEGIAKFQDDQVVDTLMKALSGADLELAAAPASENRSPKLLTFLLSGAEQQLDDLFRAKDKAKLKKQLARFHSFLSCFPGRNDKKSVGFLAGCFERRDEIARLKGDVSGQDVNQKVAAILVLTGSKPAMKKVVDSHESLAPELLPCAFVAAVQTRKPKEVYNLFSPYLLAKVGPKKRRRDPASEKREALRGLLAGVAYRRRHHYYYGVEDFDVEHGDALIKLLGDATLDPRWLDAAVAAEDLDLVEALARPKHKATVRFLSKTFEAILKKGDVDYAMAGVLETMIRIEHPRTTEHFLEGLRKVGSPRRQYYHVYWMGQLMPQLPKAAAAKIEKLLPTLPEKIVDELAPYVDELRTKS
ncbi:MAG: HEAT repeat domain-containing protein [Planctomycetota bacterium]|jgi:hypothetical protein